MWLITLYWFFFVHFDLIIANFYHNFECHNSDLLSHNFEFLYVWTFFFLSHNHIFKRKLIYKCIKCASGYKILNIKTVKGQKLCLRNDGVYAETGWTHHIGQDVQRPILTEHDGHLSGPRRTQQTMPSLSQETLEEREHLTLSTRTTRLRTSQTVLPGRCVAFPEAQWSLCRSWRSVCWPGAQGTFQCPGNNDSHWFRVESMTGVHTHTELKER